MQPFKNTNRAVCFNGRKIPHIPLEPRWALVFGNKNTIFVLFVLYYLSKLKNVRMGGNCIWRANDNLPSY